MNESVHPQGEQAAAPVGAPSTRVVIEERQAWSLNGWFGVLIALLCLGGVWWLVEHGHSYVAIVPGVVAIVILTSLVIVQPGQTRVVRFFGTYVGTVRRTGLTWIVPLADRRNVSIRVRNFETNHLKVNDADGNPVEIAAIVVWQVADTARAVYAVDDYLALRARPGRVGAASRRDHPSLRRRRAATARRCAARPTSSPTSSPREVAERVAHRGRRDRRGADQPPRLRRRDRPGDAASPAGQRRRRRALADRRGCRRAWSRWPSHGCSEHGIVELDEERKAAMVSNLMVVLCGDQPASPVVNTGTLYS